MASAMTTLISLSRLMPFLRPRYTVTPASRALTNRIAISSPNEGVMPNTRASAASTVGREMHMVTAVQNSRPRMKNTSTRAQAPYEIDGDTKRALRENVFPYWTRFPKTRFLRPGCEAGPTRTLSATCPSRARAEGATPAPATTSSCCPRGSAASWRKPRGLFARHP